MIFDFWNKLKAQQCVHPEDANVLKKHPDTFELNIPPGHINGQFKSAPIIALYLNPGFEDEDRLSFDNAEYRELLFQQIQGENDFPLWFERWKKWFIPRVRINDLDDNQLAKNVAIFNVCAYASKDAKMLTPEIIESLPSSQVAIRYLHDVLIPQAKRGERFIVVGRGAWAWKLKPSCDYECSNIRFVSSPRGGYFGPKIREEISQWLKSSNAINLTKN